jgi:hypothetical protein
MQCVVNSFNVADSHLLGRNAEREILQPFNCGRKLPPSMKYLFASQAAFHKLEEFVEELAKTTDDALDVVVILLPQNLASREIRYTEANTIFLYDDHDTDKFRAISIGNGHQFSAVVDITPKRSQTRLVTKFMDRSWPVKGLVV